MKKMKLDIQRFNSTNKTTHYELSQYVANDKPTYLVDYNDDMVAIDTAIYEAKTQADLGVNNASVAQTTADDNTTKIGDLANLPTANKANLVSAISEVNDKTPQLLNSYTSSTTNGYCANYVNDLNTYSTSETICGTWNGKPLYRKTFSGNLGQTSSINHGISNIDLIISIHGSYKKTDTGTQFSIPSVRPDFSNYEIGIYADQSTITFDKAPGIAGDVLIFNIIMEYTKTTD